MYATIVSATIFTIIIGIIFIGGGFVLMIWCLLTLAKRKDRQIWKIFPKGKNGNQPHALSINQQTVLVNGLRRELVKLDNSHPEYNNKLAKYKKENELLAEMNRKVTTITATWAHYDLKRDPETNFFE